MEDVRAYKRWRRFKHTLAFWRIPGDLMLFMLRPLYDNGELKDQRHSTVNRTEVWVKYKGEVYRYPTFVARAIDRATLEEHESHYSCEEWSSVLRRARVFGFLRRWHIL